MRLSTSFSWPFICFVSSVGSKKHSVWQTFFNRSEASILWCYFLVVLGHFFGHVYCVKMWTTVDLVGNRIFQRYSGNKHLVQSCYRPRKLLTSDLSKGKIMKHCKQDKNDITVTSAVMTGADTSNNQVKNCSDISPLYLTTAFQFGVHCPVLDQDWPVQVQEAKWSRWQP